MSNDSKTGKLQREWQLSRMQAALIFGMDMGGNIHIYIGSGIAKSCNNYGKQCGDSSEHLEWNHNLTYLSHSFVYTQRT